VKRSILGVLLVLTFVAVGIAAAPPLTFKFTDVHANKTALETDTYGVNNAGVIVGDYVDAKSVQHGMILAGTKLTTVNNSSCEAISGTGGISFYGVNSAGAAAGWCTSSKTGLAEGFVYAKGKFTAVNFPKSNGTEATGINDKGEVVGLYLDSANNAHGFLFANKKYTAINVKGATQTAAWSINNAGEISVYTGVTTTPFAAYILKGTKFTKVADPKAGSDGTVIHTINNVGDVDGTYYDSAANTHGFLLHGGKYYDVEDPNSPNLSRADGLNDKAVIVGRYGSGSFGGTGFKATYK
jgi:probable HAF family extracellular repeat protein